MNDTDFHQLPLLDAEVLAELRDVMEESFVDLIKLFLRDAPQQLQRVQSAVVQGDAGALYQVAHKFKSSCGSIGAMRLAETMRRLELAGRQNALDNTAALLRDAQNIANKTISSLETELV